MTDQNGAGTTEDVDTGDDAESVEDTDVGVEHDDGETIESGDVSPEEDLVERVQEAEPADVAREVASLRQRAEDAEEAAAEYRDRVEDLEDRLAEREDRMADLESRLKRKQADFENYKKRMDERREQERERATEALVERLLDVRDNLQRALDQDDDTDIRGGVEATLRQFDEVLEGENVERIEPGAGDEVDPQRHEVLMRVEGSDQPEGTVDRLHRPGYEMAEKVIRPAQITVSEATQAEDAGGSEAEPATTRRSDGTEEPTTDSEDSASGGDTKQDGARGGPTEATNGREGEGAGEDPSGQSDETVTSGSTPDTEQSTNGDDE